MDINWGAIGTGVAGLAAGAWGYLQGRSKRDVSDAQSQAAVSEYRADSAVTDAASRQIDQLLARVESLESKVTSLWDGLQHAKEDADKLRDRVRMLEGILRSHDIPVPPEIAPGVTITVTK